MAVAVAVPAKRSPVGPSLLIVIALVAAAAA
jgi:hypothetical protein